ncbi:GGDEF domain-containing protein [Stomatohabitans albus]|uniref:sensor domain-containing diguanylate cyclase n=1 Tax=Stomatohabitans albus TaxID=3110766 RepID=UPI00300CC39A
MNQDISPDNTPEDPLDLLPGADFFDLLSVPMLLLDLSGHITWTNRAWIDHNISPNLPDGQPGMGLHFGRDVLSVTNNALSQVLREKGKSEQDVCASDNETWWRVMFEHIETAILVFVFPTTDLHGGLDLLNAVSVAVVRTSPDGMIEWSNSVYNQLRNGFNDVGESLWNQLGHIKEWRPPRGIETSGPNEVWLPCQDGGTWVEVHTRPLTNGDRLIGHLATLYDITIRMELRRQAEKAWVDELTCLANRRGLQRALEKVRLMREGTLGRSLAFMMIDLNGFKQVNDLKGHKAGDEVLRAVAERLRAIVRHTDTPARLGGDEFAVLLPYATEEEAMRVAKRVDMALSRPVLIDEAPVNTGASVGIVLTDEVKSFSDLLVAADDAMYASKREQGGPVLIRDFIEST